MHRIIILVSILLLASCSYVQEKPISLDFSDKTVLIVYGGWEGHQPGKFAQKVSKWLESKEAKVILSDTVSIYADKQVMENVDFIVQYITMSEMEPEASKGLLEAVKNGTGLAGCHGGLGDSFRQNTDYQYMVGGQFVKHPGGQIPYTVNIKDPNDFVTRGVHDFSLTSEQYYMHVDTNVKVLATTAFNSTYDDWIANAIIPVAWKKYHGKGRVFYFSLGHALEVFDQKEAWTILTRGMHWASLSKQATVEKWVHPVYQ